MECISKPRSAIAAVALLSMWGAEAAAEPRIISYALYAQAARQGYWIITSRVPAPGGRGLWLYCQDISVGRGYAGRPDLVVVEMGRGGWSLNNCGSVRRTVLTYVPPIIVGPPGPPRPPGPTGKTGPRGNTPGPGPRPGGPGWDDLPVGR